MWSMSKAVSAVAVYKSTSKPSRLLREALVGAITRSENCRQRRVVLGLQQLATQKGSSASSEVKDVLLAAGVPAGDLSIPEERHPLDGDQNCLSYLRAVWHDPTEAAPQLGTATWRPRDGALFGLALAEGPAGPYGAASIPVLDLMRRKKGPSLDPGVTPSDYTVTSNSWGAGNSLARWQPAYKGGWGGSAASLYIVGQVVAMDVNGVPVGLMAVFHPTARPATDDPGRTTGPAALEEIFNAVGSALRKVRPSS
jgi:hypothetical protein